MDIEIKDRFLVRINAPEFYEDDEFVEFLNRGVAGDSISPIATWHDGGKPGQDSDLFVTYDNGGGSDALPTDGDDLDANLIPQHIWDRICEEMNARGIDHALLWISNLRETKKNPPNWDVTIQQNYADGSFDRAEMTVTADDPETVKDKAWRRFDETFDAAYVRGEDIEHTSASFCAEEQTGDRTIEYTV